MKRSIAPFALACGLVLAACSDTTSETETPSATESVTEETTEPQSSAEPSETPSETSDGEDGGGDGDEEQVEYLPTISRALALGNAGPPMTVSFASESDLNVDAETFERLKLDFPFSLEDVDAAAQSWEQNDEQVTFEEVLQTTPPADATANLTDNIPLEVRAGGSDMWETTLSASEIMGEDIEPSDNSPLLEYLGKADEYWFSADESHQSLAMVYDFGEYVGIVEINEREGFDPNPMLMNYMTRGYYDSYRVHDLDGMEKVR